jgi:HEAT repeat protein
LKHQNAKVRFAALQAFAAMKPEDVLLAARDVTACLDDLDADVRRKAVYVVGIIGDKNEAAFEALVKSLNDKDLSVVEAAADTLQKVEAPPKEALPALTKLAGDANYQIRTTALKLLGKLGAPAIPVFKEHLKKLNADERGPILESLATMGKAAKPVLPELQAILIEDRWWDGSNHIFAIIKNCGPDGAQTLADVLKVLHDPKTPHFEAAEDRARTLLKALGDMGPQAAAATPVLIVMLKDREPLRPNVLDTLGDIGPAAKDAIPAVQALTADPRVGSMARATLKRMGVLSNK